MSVNPNNARGWVRADVSLGWKTVVGDWKCWGEEPQMGDITTEGPARGT